jgi:hypothetical protein
VGLVIYLYIYRASLYDHCANWKFLDFRIAIQFDKVQVKRFDNMGLPGYFLLYFMVNPIIHIVLDMG